jgi:lipopolysaccharide biosynthesis regulator YciM
MDFDLSWLLLALPATFGLGWLASRLDLRQVRREHKDAPRAYFKGLSLLLNEQQDKAIDVFIEAIQNDPDTVDLHFALGSLFRRRGEFQRAIRVHEHLLTRADLPLEERHRARHALAQDFLRAGLFDRAEDSFQQLEGTTFQTQARLALLSLRERAREWDGAIEVASLLQASDAGSFAARIGHYHCEAATELRARGDMAAASARLEAARQAAPDLARPGVLAGQWALQDGHVQTALQAWAGLLQRNPRAFDLIAADYAAAAREQGLGEDARRLMQAQFAQVPTLALLRALLGLDLPTPQRTGQAAPAEAIPMQPADRVSGSVAGGTTAAEHDGALGPQAVQRLVQALKVMPSLSAAGLLMRQPVETWGNDGLEAARAAVERAARPVQRYRCAACGFEAQRYFWQCPGCLGWDTFPPQTIEEL